MIDNVRICAETHAEIAARCTCDNFSMRQRTACTFKRNEMLNDELPQEINEVFLGLVKALGC